MEEFSYIVLDLEWNQPMSGQEIITRPFRFDSEIIEIGALKLNNRFEEMSEFKSFVRPVFYPSMNGHVVQLTKIRPQELEKAPDFPAAYAAFRDWCGEDCCLCTWGPDDLPVLMDNLLMHGLDAALPDGYDLQRIFGHEIMRDDRQCSLERAMELLRLKPDRATTPSTMPATPSGSAAAWIWSAAWRSTACTTSATAQTGWRAG